VVWAAAIGTKSGAPESRTRATVASEMESFFFIEDYLL
jgi:hypothetical protein